MKKILLLGVLLLAACAKEQPPMIDELGEESSSSVPSLFQSSSAAASSEAKATSPSISVSSSAASSTANTAKAPLPALPSTTSPSFLPPLERAMERITKKPFGLYATPKDSPVQPERFSGWHSGIDFEIFPGEENEDVVVNAICTGSVRFRGWISGYGGLVIQQCKHDDEPVTVLYGHVSLDSVTATSGTTLTAGDTIGILGKGFSEETDGERKHLHLGVHKGPSLVYRGYENTEAALSAWIDPFPS